MIVGERVLLRPIREGDWTAIEAWGQSRQGLWGPYQRYQMDHIPLLREAYEKSGLLKRDSGFLVVENLKDHRPIGFVRYTLTPFPDADFPYPEIGFGIADANVRGQGFASEAVGVLVGYLLAGYATERISAFTDADNVAAQRVLERLGFVREGVLRRTAFRDGSWHDLVAYGLLRNEWTRVEDHGHDERRRTEQTR